MEIGKLVLGYIQVLVWPCVVIIFFIRYHRIIESAIPKTKVKLTIAGITIEPSLQQLVDAVETPFPGNKLSKKQIEWLKRLNKNGRQKFVYDKDYENLRPMRDAGLIRANPPGYLTHATDVEITGIGELLLQAEAHPREKGKLPD